MLDSQDPRQIRYFREIAAMSNLKHSNIIIYITSWIEKDTSHRKSTADSFDLNYLLPTNTHTHHKSL